MDYLIDTNIVYYLTGLSEDKNFLIEDFINDSTPKIISSISIIELYLKYDIKTFREIMKKLDNYKLHLIIYGDNVNYNENVSLKKLSTKPTSYLKRILAYFEKISVDYIAKNIMYLGFLIGGMYTYLLKIKKGGKKIKDYDFIYIGLKDKEKILLDMIKKDILQYYSTRKEEDCNKIFGNVRNIILMAIADYLYNKNKDRISKKSEDYFHRICNIKLNCHKLMVTVCKAKNLKAKDIINKFYLSFNLSTKLNFNGLENIVKYLFLNNKLEWNDFSDFTIINIAEKLTNCAIITSDKSKQEFLKENSIDNKCATISCQELLKYYKQVGI